MSSPLNMSLPLDTCVEESAEEIERKCNQLIEEVLKSPKEYTTKNLEGYESELKEDLMKFLKRADMTPTKIADYQYGFSTKLEANKSLIVTEKDDRTKCREYSAYRTYDQFCLQCRSLSNHKVLLYSRIIQGILFVPVKHVCAPKEYDAVMEVQEKMKEGDLKAALSLQRKYAVRKHPRYFFPKEKPRKRSKASSTSSNNGKSSKVGQKKDTVEVSSAAAAEVAEGHNDIDLSCFESLKDDVSDVIDSAMSNQQLCVTKNVDTSSSPGAAGKPDVLFQSDQLEDLNNNASTSDVKPLDASEMLEAEEDTVNDDGSDSKHEATSPFDSQTVISSNDPIHAFASIDTKRGHKGRKRGSKNLLFAKNYLDLIDAIKSLLPPPSSDENSAPKKRRRRRKASIHASSSEAIKLDDDENLDFSASTNITATILDMIDSQTYMSENSTTSDAENTDDCEILEDNLYLPIQHEDHHGRYTRTRSETITIED